MYVSMYVNMYCIFSEYDLNIYTCALHKKPLTRIIKNDLNKIGVKTLKYV